jgi:murein DD-endopeptidase MepM/ murein hydrolase activator NlpD
MNLEAPRGPTRTSHGASLYTPLVASTPPPVSSTSRESEAGSTSVAKPLPIGASTITEADINLLSVKNLLIPVAGVTANQLHDSFYDARSDDRTHGAIDIMAARDAPVLAAVDGKVMKLHQSDRGGIMLYESDQSGIYVYYYAHLSHYAEGVFEGKEVKRGDVIAYVGDTGNASAGNFHLHFGISKMSAPGKWSGGEPINPYPLLTEKPGTPSIGGR